MKLILTILSYAMTLLGTIHTVLTPVFYPRLTPGAAWFAGTGLALVFLGLLNYASAKVFQKWLLNICAVADIVGVVFTCLIVITLPSLQSFIALAIFCLTAAACALLRAKAQ